MSEQLPTSSEKPGLIEVPEEWRPRTDYTPVSQVGERVTDTREGVNIPLTAEQVAMMSTEEVQRAAQRSGAPEEEALAVHQHAINSLAEEAQVAQRVVEGEQQ